MLPPGSHYSSHTSRTPMANMRPWMWSRHSSYVISPALPNGFSIIEFLLSSLVTQIQGIVFSLIILQIEANASSMRSSGSSTATASWRSVQRSGSTTLPRSYPMRPVNITVTTHRSLDSDQNDTPLFNSDDVTKEPKHLPVVKEEDPTWYFPRRLRMNIIIVSESQINGKFSSMLPQVHQAFFYSFLVSQVARISVSQDNSIKIWR